MLKTDRLPIVLFPVDLLGTPLADITGRSFEALGEQMFAFARSFLPRVLPLRGDDLDRALVDLVVRARASAALRRSIEACADGWAGVLMATAVQVWADGVTIRGSEVDFDSATLRATARILCSSKLPAGLVLHADERAGIAIKLERITRDADRIREESPRGRPIDPASELFARLEGPLARFSKPKRAGLSKPDRARLAAGLLAELAGEQADWDKILAADKASRARGRKLAEARALDHVCMGD